MEQNNPSQDNEQPVKKLLDPTDKQVHISAKRQARNYTLISKLIALQLNHSKSFILLYQIGHGDYVNVF